MKYTEFEAKVKEIDASLIVEHAGKHLFVRNDSRAGSICIWKTITYAIDTTYPTWERTGEVLKAKLYYLAVELAATPLEEREEQKKYYYRLAYVTRGYMYLNFRIYDDLLLYNTSVQTPRHQTQFTREEYAAIAKEHGIPEGVHISEEVTK